MAIYKTPYDTTAGLGYRYANIAHELKTALAGNGLGLGTVADGQESHPQFGSMGSSGKRIGLALVQGGNSFADAVHFLKHPVLIHHGGQELACVDVREFGKWDAHQQQFVVRNVPEYVWAIKRAILTWQWGQGRTDALRDLSNLPAQVYCSLVSESIARRFALDAAEQATIAVLAGLFYYGLFTDDVEISEDEKNALAGKIARITFVDAQRVFQIIDPVGPRMVGMANFCDVIRAQVSNVALENLNEGILFQVVGGTWIGHNSRETLCMALEHPPTWVLIVAASLTSATFKRSTLAKLSARLDKRGAGASLAQGLAVLLGGPDGAEGLDAYSRNFGSA